jgi:hypothetical protein
MTDSSRPYSGYYDAVTENIFVPLCGWCGTYHRGFCPQSNATGGNAGKNYNVVMAATGSLGSLADEDRLLADVLRRLLSGDLTWHITDISLVVGDVEVLLSSRQRIAILSWMRDE